jgi:beta-1,4-mannosyl-glycoprotein beta-1,4-N-acetylglucosaminyltransferase
VIYDCFTFFDELDLLELRLRTLDAVVDRFVLCESPFTFTGKPKPLYFAESAERFAPWRNKIVALVYPGPSNESPWENEWSQRDYLATALGSCEGDDLILLSDCDEIPDPRNVGARPQAKLLLAHRQRMSVGFVNRISRMPWLGTRSFPWRNAAACGRMRDVRMLADSELEFIEGGWHFSYLGGATAIARKFSSYAHTEFDLPYFTDLRRIEIEYASSVDAECLPIDASFPEALRDVERWGKYIWRGDGMADPKRVSALQHAHGCFAYVPSDAVEVSALSADAELWNECGAQRFGTAFRPRGNALPAGGWYVADGFETLSNVELAEFARPDVGLVAFVRNARSFSYLDGLLTGKIAPLGRALGLSEVRTWVEDAGKTIARADRVQSPYAFIPWAEMSDVMASVQLTRWASFSMITREALADFVAQGFVVAVPPVDRRAARA